MKKLKIISERVISVVITSVKVLIKEIDIEEGSFLIFEAIIGRIIPIKLLKRIEIRIVIEETQMIIKYFFISVSSNCLVAL